MGDAPSNNMALISCSVVFGFDLFQPCLCCVRHRQEVEVSRQRYVFGAVQLQRLNELLAQYEGTHNYHNFTVCTSGVE